MVHLRLLLLFGVSPPLPELLELDEVEVDDEELPALEVAAVVDPPLTAPLPPPPAVSVVLPSGAEGFCVDGLLAPLESPPCRPPPLPGGPPALPPDDLRLASPDNTKKKLLLNWKNFEA